MINKIKDLMRTKEGIDEINKKVEENSKIISDLKNELELLRKGLIETKSGQQEFLKEFRENIFVIKNLKEDFGKEIYEFKMLKAQLQKKILEKFEEELRNDLEINREDLRKDAHDYNELKKKAAEIMSRLNLTIAEISKFIEIGKSIKKEDFELSKFARHLIDMDREKLNLMRKIDSLERLVSKIRRKEF